jgi:DNA-binding NarL/FixJ family response regulator
MMKPIRVVLAEDHRLVRAGLRALLETSSKIEVVGEADDGRGALALVARERPALVLMDIAMPSLDGLETTRRIVKEYPDVRVIILSMHTDDKFVLQALRAGARGYLLKEAVPRELELAVDAVLRGEVFLSPPISKRVIKDYLRRAGDETSPLEQLSPRQREILKLIAEGKSTKQIAGLLETSVKTVETHRSVLMERLDIHDIAGLVRFAIRHGLVSAER